MAQAAQIQKAVTEERHPDTTRHERLHVSYLVLSWTAEAPVIDLTLSHMWASIGQNRK